TATSYIYFYRYNFCVKPLLQSATTATAGCCRFFELLQSVRAFAFNYCRLQPLVLRADRTDRAFFPLLLHCVTALPRSTSTTAANCHQRYGSKQRGGKPRRWGSVICRSMENSVCELVRAQLAEARGIGGLIWRMDVTAEFVGDERRRS